MRYVIITLQSFVPVQGVWGTVFLLSQDCGSRLIPAQQLREQSGAHASGQDCPGQLSGARPGEGCPIGTGLEACGKKTKS